MTGPHPADVLRRLAGPDPATDRDLLRRFATTRDGAAFAELVRRHGPVVLAACRRGVRHHHDADDAFQAVFLVMARRAGAIQRPELLGNWLYQVAVRVARNARRAAARRRLWEVQGVDVPEPVAPAPAARDDLRPVLDDALGGLPAWYRDAIILCDLRGVSRAEAAAHLGIPLGTLASRLDAGRKKLAAGLTRRGVALSVAALPGVLADGRAAVPEELVSDTCGLAAVWAAGGAVPAAVLRLARGGVSMRGVLLGGVLTLSLAAGAVLAAGLAGPPAAPLPPPGPPAAAAAGPDAQPRPAPEAAPPAKLGAPRLTRTTDLNVQTVSAAAWSPDGAWLAVAAATASSPPVGMKAGATALAVLAPADPKRTPAVAPLPPGSELVGFTPDGKWVLAATRETGLISGTHALHRVRVTARVAPGGGGTVGLVDDHDPGAVPNGGEQLTPTGPGDVRFLVREPRNGGAGRVTVWHSDLRLEARWPLGSFDGPFAALCLAPDGKRVIGLAGSVVAGYDATTGNRLWATEPAVKLSEVTLGAQGVSSREEIPPRVPLAVAFSLDGRRAVVARGRVTPVLVLDAGMGKALPLPAELEQVDLLGPVAVSGDGRLAALAYTPLMRLDDKEKRPSNVPAFAAPTHVRGPARLTVWDTAAGTVVRTWPGRAGAVAFHPTRPVLAVLEAHGSGTRLGLWDFAEQP